MCIKLVQKILYMPLAMSAPEKFVFITLAQHYNPITGQCNPSTARLAGLTGLSVRTVKRAIQALIRDGYIRVSWQSNGRHANRYIFNKDIYSWQDSYPQPGQGGTVEPGQPDTVTVSESHHNRVTVSRERCHSGPQKNKERIKKEGTVNSQNLTPNAERIAAIASRGRTH
jgi:DNA-binding transcriptional MocR family regulator